MRAWVVIMVMGAGLGAYSLRAPKGWRAHTIRPQPGHVLTTLAPRSGDAAIQIYVYPGSGPPSDDALPDVGCHRVTIGGIRGRRCRTLPGGAPVTILQAGGRTYRISAQPGVPSATYDRVVRSFRLRRPPAP